MSITTYTELQTAMGNWSHRGTDATATALFPDFIRLFEARMNRLLRVRAMEAALTSSALTLGAVALPADFLAFKELRFDGSPGYTLQPKTLEWLRDQPDLATSPLYFAVSGSQVVCWPQTGSIKGTYYAAIPALASNATNWLLTRHPDLYLYGSLEQLADWLGDDESQVKWGQRTLALIDQVQSDDNANQINGGPLVARAR